ncbi:asparagine synthase-related protein [uncultured Psychroserpens sp.]|uniref:asparagine synthase-related protein n=1 Tax=uncultured Psychroserpens sp. TaxID=255436 RepID=UPI00261354A7|nr:asparagine synthase-related protein [uncultured Psychroserpens sp.]
MELKTTIIPKSQTFARVDQPRELNLEAICVFAAIGFFLDEDTYWKNEVVLGPASVHSINDKGNRINSKPWFEWHYSPRDIPFEQAEQEFASLLESIILEQTKGEHVILPLSGGLDSRTQAVALKQVGADVISYSYKFQNGYNETAIAKKIAKASQFKYRDFDISRGYLWNSIDQLFELNQGYSDFTTPRQMGIFNAYADMGTVFSLGHWGDVLFDTMNLPQLSNDEEIDVISKKLIKRGGLEFAETLWNLWALEGDFKTYFKTRIEVLLNTINIDDTNAKLRAFKSLYWAPRWTSINLSVFEAHHPITLPYFDDRMCQFICTVPEAFLKDRQLQITYIKNKSPELAKIEWQDQRPFNLYNYHMNKIPYNLPYKLLNKSKRVLQSIFGNDYVQRNWELQFLGDANKEMLSSYLLNDMFNQWVSKSVSEAYLNDFYNGNSLENAHPLNILLVLSKFKQTY